MRDIQHYMIEMFGQPGDESAIENELTYVPGDDGQFHIADGNGGTLCGERMALNATLMQTCDKCERIAD
jgi:hypothetical protein